MSNFTRSNFVRTSIVIRHDDEDKKGVLNYEAKKIDMEMPRSARQFVTEQPLELGPQFVIDELISKQTGIFEKEKMKVEQAIDDKVIEKLKDIQEKAYKEAYELGLEEGKKLAYDNNQEAIKFHLSEMITLFENLKTMKKDILNKNESVFVDLIYHIAEKVVMEHVQKSETTTVEVIKQVVDSLDVKEDISVRLNQEDFAIMQKLMGENSQEAEIFKKLKFYADPEIQKGGCMFETNHGLVDATLEERIAKLWTLLNQTKPV
ncbi:MAG: FliH/SctL family protein [Bdellovibrionota bacterium]